MKRESFRLRPTGLWILFGPILGCMWLAAVNYSNNLVYAVLYLVGSLTFVSIFHAWRNLAQLEVEYVQVKPAFAGEDIAVEIHLRNPGKYPVYGLNFARLGEIVGLRRSVPLIQRGGGTVRIDPRDARTVELYFPSGSRGLYRFETLLVRSAYPFGLVGAAFRVQVAADYYVYPQAKGLAAWPELRPSGQSGVRISPSPGDDFAGVRTYMPGESVRHIDWKAYARGRPLSVKQFTGGDGHELWFDAAALEHIPLEKRLSQLALWVVNAEKEDIPYALKLGRTLLPVGLGSQQSRRALEALAVAGVGHGK